MVTVLEEDDMLFGGLRFMKSGDGGMHVTIYDGLAENSPVAREVIFDKERVDELFAMVCEAKINKPRRKKKVKKTR